MDYMIEAEGLRSASETRRRWTGSTSPRARGSVLGVLGPNGAGKTTAVRILATLLGADEGTRPRRRPRRRLRDPRRVREAIGLTGQYASVDELLTGSQNLVMIGQLLDLTGKRGARPREGAARPGST